MSLSALYKSLSGLIGFTKSLDNLSNNVANVNTPGFKGRDIFFRDLIGSDNQGEGVSVSGNSVRFANGDITQTGNATDLAIDGNGFFVLRDGNETFYTRSGQFRFDNEGYLVDPVSNTRVAGLTEGGQLTDINIASIENSSPIATSEVDLTGNLNIGAVVGSTFPTDPVTDPFEVQVFDSQGTLTTLRLIFTKQAGSEYTVQVTDQAGVNIGAAQSIQFAGDGSPIAGFNQVTITLAPSGGVTPSNITFDFGDPGTFSGVTGFSSATSTVDIGEIDGRALGEIVDFNFNTEGTLTVAYSNGEVDDIQKLALASFTNLNDLQIAGDTLFQVRDETSRILSFAGEGNFGFIAPASLELSNVELSREFADIIIVQRGFQASSQVLSVTNEVIEELYNSVRG